MCGCLGSRPAAVLEWDGPGADSSDVPSSCDDGGYPLKQDQEPPFCEVIPQAASYCGLDCVSRTDVVFGVEHPHQAWQLRDGALNELKARPARHAAARGGESQQRPFWRAFSCIDNGHRRRSVDERVEVLIIEPETVAAYLIMHMHHLVRSVMMT